MINENDDARNAIMGIFGLGDQPIAEKEIESTKSAPAEVTGCFKEPKTSPPVEEPKKAIHETSATKRLSLDMLGEVLGRQVNEKQVGVPTKSTTPEARKAVAEQLSQKKNTSRLNDLLERLM